MNETYNFSWSSRLMGLATITLFVVVGYKIFAYFDNHNWPDVTGRVTETAVTTTQNWSRRGYNRTFYYAHVKYVYVVDHVSYVHDDIMATFRTPMDAQTFFANRYWKDQHLRVVYRPGKPQDASLIRSTF